MKIHLAIVIAISVLFISCTTWKNTMVSTGTDSEGIKNAITDFLHSGKFNKRDTVFSVYLLNINENILGISISEESNKIAVITENNINYNYKAFPTNYIEENGKLFYWKDSTKAISTELVNKLYKMNRIDTAIINSYFPDRKRDDSKKAMHYYFCKKDLRIYEKVYTKIAMGWYGIPKLNCR